jgi:hypothetical protein
VDSRSDLSAGSANWSSTTLGGVPEQEKPQEQHSAFGSSAPLVNRDGDSTANGTNYDDADEKKADVQPSAQTRIDGKFTSVARSAMSVLKGGKGN